jgi:hypothetical protein
VLAAECEFALTALPIAKLLCGHPSRKHLEIRLTSNRSMAVTKELWIRSRRDSKTVLLLGLVTHVSAVFTTTALFGLAPMCSTRASAAHHRESISACQSDVRCN